MLIVRIAQDANGLRVSDSATKSELTFVVLEIDGFFAVAGEIVEQILDRVLKERFVAIVYFGEGFLN